MNLKSKILFIIRESMHYSGPLFKFKIGHIKRKISEVYIENNKNIVWYKIKAWVIKWVHLLPYILSN
jgi:hypothetical protein